MTHSEIIKLIKVTNYELDKEGLWIEYQFNNKNFDLLADAETTAELFKKAGYIEDYNPAHSGFELDVTIEWDNEYRVKYYWSDFIELFTFSQKDAIEIAAYHEADKELQLNPLIQDIVNKHFL